MRIKLATYKNLSLKIKRQLGCLGLKHGQICSMARNNPNSKVLLCLEKEKVLGWLLFVPNNHYFYDDIGTPECWIYVRRSNRRMGVGTKLILEALKLKNTIFIYKAKYNEKFFNSISKRKLAKPYNNRFTKL